MSALYQIFFPLPISDLIESFFISFFTWKKSVFISLFCPFLLNLQMIPHLVPISAGVSPVCF